MEQNRHQHSLWIAGKVRNMVSCRTYPTFTEVKSITCKCFPAFGMIFPMSTIRKTPYCGFDTNQVDLIDRFTFLCQKDPVISHNH